MQNEFTFMLLFTNEIVNGPPVVDCGYVKNEEEEEEEEEEAQKQI